MLHTYFLSSLRWQKIALLVVFVTILCGCNLLTNALPPTPEPFPTLARLPTVTPEPPTPTPLPTSTPRPTPTPLPPKPVESRILVGANLRTGPGLDYTVISVLVQDTTVTISGKSGDWYKITTADGMSGWMSREVLDITPEEAITVPTITP